MVSKGLVYLNITANNIIDSKCDEGLVDLFVINLIKQPQPWGSRGCEAVRWAITLVVCTEWWAITLVVCTEWWAITLVGCIEWWGSSCFGQTPYRASNSAMK